MSESNGYATPESLFGRPVVRRYRDETIEGLGKFRLRSLTDREKSTYDAAAINKEGKFNRHAAIDANARLVQLCCVDADGNLAFSKSQVSDLQGLDSGLMSKLADACREHCGFEDAEEAAKN